MILPGEEGGGMRYGMIGDDTASTKEKLEKYTGEVDWSYLKPHFESDALLFVDPALSITAVGKAISEDDSDVVKAWMKSGDVLKPSEPHAIYWEESKARFTALVVSPFVLVQPV